MPSYFDDGNTPSATDNQWKTLQKILGTLKEESLTVSVGATYTTVSGVGPVTVNTTLATVRAASPSAKKTVVVNTGSTALTLYEGGFAVAVLQPSQIWESPLSGKLIIQALTTSGSTTALATTFT